MRDIFISHVEENSDLAIAIAAGLEAEDFSCWYYERDSLPGPSYLLQTSGQIEASKAVVLIISPHSLSSHQVTKEVIRAHESGKPFIPVLSEISHVEFASRQPEWREAVGSATSISVPADGVTSILPRILNGVRGLGITPSGTDGLETPIATVSYRASTPPPSKPVVSGLKGPALWPKVALAVAAAVLIGGAAGGVSLLSGGDEPQEQVATDPIASVPAIEAEEPPLEVVGVEELEEGQQRVDVKLASETNIKTTVGALRVAEARLTREACPPPGISGDCHTAVGSDRYLVVTLRRADGGAASLTHVFLNEATASAVTAPGGLQASNYRVSLDQAQGTIEIVYGILPARSLNEQVLLYWPKNKVLELWS